MDEEHDLCLGLFEASVSEEIDIVVRGPRGSAGRAPRRCTRPAFNPNLPANASFDPSKLAGQPSSFKFSYDPAQNLVSSTVKAFGIPQQTPMPPDASGRNRPGSIAGVALAYDGTGNLTQKGDQHFHYDFRNRLTRITDAQGGEVAAYTYDAFNRRVAKDLPGTTLTTVWSGWQAIEEYQNGQLSRRRIHGAGLNEIVREELDLDGDGFLEPGYVPLYDSIGNLVALTDLDGDVLERYRFSPFGLGTIRVDSTAPNLDQLLFRNGTFRLGFSEELSTLGLLATISEDGIRIEQFDPNQPELPPQDLGPLDLQPIQLENCGPELGCGTTGGASTSGPLTSLAGAAVSRDISSTLRSPGASLWFALTVANPPAAGAQVRVTIASSAFEDLFQNPSTQEVVEEFTWGPGETVLLDAAPPRVRAVRLVESHLEIELSEEPDLPTAQAAIDVGQPATWALSADGLTLRSEAPLLGGGFTLTIQPSLSDLAGRLLQQLFALSLVIPAIESNAVFFEEPDPQETQASSVGNVYGFHGHPRDPESGLIYIRNRYYDPELGRFITADPMGYVDGPSMYQFGGYSPVNLGDPLGLERKVKDAQTPAGKKIQEEYEKAYREDFLSSKEGRAAHEELDALKGYTLYVEFDPLLRGKERVMEVGKYKFDSEGNLISATLTVGPNWNTGPSVPSPPYRVGNKLKKANASSREKNIWRIAHEEQGHGMLPLKSGEYLDVLMKKEDYNRKWRELVAKLEATYPDDPEMQDKLKREFAVRNYKQEWKDFLEEEADINTLTFLPPPLRKKVESMIKLEREIEELRERRAKRQGQKTEGGGL